MMTKNQVELLQKAFGNGMSLPALTNDAQVNFEADKLLGRVGSIEEWDELEFTVKRAYIREAESTIHYHGEKGGPF